MSTLQHAFEIIVIAKGMSKKTSIITAKITSLEIPISMSEITKNKVSVVIKQIK